MKVKREREVQNLPCSLTNEELADRSQQLAGAVTRVERAKDAKKSLDAQLTSEIKLHEAKRNELSSTVSTGKEYREVTVEVRFDFEKGIREELRLDTGEIFTERPLSDDEKQLALDIVEEDQFRSADDETPKT